jgi:microcystin degradation protein MlrC
MKAVEVGRTPVIIADQSDRTGDGTHILKELLMQKARNFVVATIADDVAIKEIRQRAKVGENIIIDVGGYACEGSGKPVTISGIVEHLGSCEYVHNGPMLPGAKVRIGEIAVLGFGENNHLIISQTLQQLYDDAIFSSVGIDPDSLEIIVIKSRVHFKAYFKDVAGAIIVIDTPGIGFSDLKQLKYKNVPKEIYPVGDKWR